MAEREPEADIVSGRPLYAIVEEEMHDFIDGERRRRRLPGRAPLHKAVVVREALGDYKALVQLGARIGPDGPDADVLQELIALARRTQEPVDAKHLRSYSKEVEA